VFEAKVIKDSICNGRRLTTMQVTMPRIILAEWNKYYKIEKTVRVCPHANVAWPDKSHIDFLTYEKPDLKEEVNE
jgi:hypothetical protein